MHPTNLAFISKAGFRLYGLSWVVCALIWVVEELYKHPMIGIPVGILLICVVIVVMVRIVQMLRGKI